MLKNGGEIVQDLKTIKSAGEDLPRADTCIEGGVGGDFYTGIILPGKVLWGKICALQIPKLHLPHAQHNVQAHAPFRFTKMFKSNCQ